MTSSIVTVPPAILETLARAERVLVLTHVYPDGDALGSQLALGHCLKAAGRQVVLYGEEPVSHLYAFLPGSDTIVTQVADPGGFDCAVALDCGDAARLGREEERLLAARPFIVIDHHRGHRDFGDLRWVDANRGSTGEMVYDLVRALGLPLGLDAAFCLYAAIVSDTGSFKYGSTTPRTLAIAGELLEVGVRPEVVAGRLYDNYTVGRLQLLQRVLATLELHEDGRLAVIHVTQEMLAATGTRDEDTENFINYPRSLAQVRVAVFLKETRQNMVAVSMRSKIAADDVSTVARRFGGGGHCNAAGFKIAAANLEAVRGQVLEALRPLVRRPVPADGAG